MGFITNDFFSVARLPPSYFPFLGSLFFTSGHQSQQLHPDQHYLVTHFKNVPSNERPLVIARSFESIEIERDEECNSNMIAIVKQWSLFSKSHSPALHEDNWRETQCACTWMTLLFPDYAT
ncbi:hypothetical protein CY34DRAFT_811686 [Suillus luteus UH-Slu-Lm8-n1]|uniref:Uncharacterized protein n=1 Tax=Suillus luteus UH-Slu-Lm8-n1 TaxID=930992 RepID=A0A0C9ZEX8_9AGAM|nr:hypothetical protein CY34DRAFT_811686 [Suillus luteus UH-Slu-Lm8-n1]